jgi:hypothetical protein
MRYKCVANPMCLKTFEYGHALRAHIATCHEAQKILRKQAQIDKLEHEISVEYPGIHGLHTNTFYPINHNTDKSNKYQFKDRFLFNASSNPSETKSKSNQQIRPIRAKTVHNLHQSAQVYSALSYTS